MVPMQLSTSLGTRPVRGGGRVLECAYMHGELAISADTTHVFTNDLLVAPLNFC